MKFRIYSNLKKKTYTFGINRTNNGWNISWLRTVEDSNKSGEPYLFKYLSNEGIYYPNSLNDYMERLWEKAEDEKMNEEEIQKYLDILCKWIDKINNEAPKDDIWIGV